jgi:F-box/leucine-rich repeat protein 2/20
MHELRYLKLYYSKLNNEALFAILDSCPHMEYLHLQYCVNILLNGAMRAKCGGI